ncbi:MAG: pyruvate dehydrogenase (acetyl-transferring) E1 component subunit alpha [Steroidobacteraceae bacterium]
MKTVAEFQIRYQQLLDQSGKAVAELPAFARDSDELLRMYRMMMLTRTFDTKAVNLQRTGKLGTYAPCVGHEATHVGVGAAMRPEDALFPYYREYGAQLWRGVSLAEIFIYWGGDERGNDFAVPRHDFPWSVPIASQVPQAAGAAMAFRIRKQPRCAVAFIGDGGTSQGAFYEAINLAGAKTLPLVTVIVNNGYAISMPVSEQSATQTLAQKAIAAGIVGVQVDGNDILAVRAATAEALERGRTGKGATLIEAITYRLSDHTTADDASRYREAAQLEAAWKVEPITRLRSYLHGLGAWDEAREKALRAECTREVEAALQIYLKHPKPSSDAMFEHLFARMPHGLEEQRATARRFPAPDKH